MKRFSVVENGYDIDEVNRFIDIVIGRLEKLNAENAAYVAKIDKLNLKLQETKPNDDKLEKAILAVQETADRMKEVSREEARIIVEEAKNNANSIVHEALVRAEKIEHDSMVLEKNMKVYKERIKTLLETQLRIAEDLDKVEL
ncbi:MAG: DivIVA domain-containing protein [Bacilli bacterium]|nr:DivIVA domain-containing protein [Bacilli bacterium]